jgi:hypothetical protein
MLDRMVILLADHGANEVRRRTCETLATTEVRKPSGRGGGAPPILAVAATYRTIPNLRCVAFGVWIAESGSSFR